MIQKRFQVFICILLLVLMLPGCQSRPEDIEALSDKLYGKLNNYAGSGSVSVLVVKNGEKILEKSYGYRNVETGEIATPNTNYRLGCITKNFTCTGILLLKEKGLLDLDWKVSKVLKDFPGYAGDVTIRHCMNNTSGLPYYQDLWPADGEYLRDEKVYELIKKADKLKYPPGFYAEASNDTAFAILALVIEAVSGQTYQDFMAENVFRPIGMNNTVALVEGYNSVPERAYGTGSKNGAVCIADQYAYSPVLGDGGIYTNLHDMYLWNQAVDKNLLISEKTYTEVLSGGNNITNILYHYDNKHTYTKFSSGLYISEYKGHKLVGTEGGTIGFSNSYFKVPEKNLCVLILTNRDNNWSIMEDSNKILDIALNLPD